jgi:hypothetical protein
VLARPVLNELEGPGPDGVGAELVAQLAECLRRHAVDRGGIAEQRPVRPFRDEVDGMRVLHLDLADGLQARPRRMARRGRPDLLEGELHRLRGEVLAIVELDAAPERPAQCRGRYLLPLRDEAGNRVGALVAPDESVEHVLEHRPARHARLDTRVEMARIARHRHDQLARAGERA